MEDRIVDLEIRIAHHEASIDELTQKLLLQEKTMGELYRELEYVKSLLRDLAPSAVAPASEETPPPHY